jgi:hypothetical protein
MTDDSLRTFQAQFARGLLGADPTECEADFGMCYAVHARNVSTSLQVALEQVFPVVREVVGVDFFAQAARAFIAVAPPRRGWLSAYGGGFPDFIATYQPASAVPYLGDLARLEWARVAATFGDVEAGFDLGALATLLPQDLMERVLRVHPCTTLIRSAYSVFSIWGAHFDPTATSDLLAAVSADPNPEDLLITKAPSGEVVVKRLQSGEAAFLSGLISEVPLGSAWHNALDTDPQFDLAATLVGLAAENALAD